MSGQNSTASTQQRIGREQDQEIDLAGGETGRLQHRDGTDVVGADREDAPGAERRLDMAVAVHLLPQKGPTSRQRLTWPAGSLSAETEIVASELTLIVCGSSRSNRRMKLESPRRLML
ncbi:MAG: hypothetical protein WDM81_14445 [Rhizomicrobium sp.]